MSDPTRVRPARPRASSGHTRLGRRSLGLDRLLVRAALDVRYRELLLRDRPAALREGGIRLGPVEERILLGVTTPQLAELVRVAVPRADRRDFLLAASASVAALVAAGAGCQEGPGGLPDGQVVSDRWIVSDRWMIPDTASHDGCRPDVDPLCDVGTPGNYWITLGDRPALVYLPRSFEMGQEYPWCLVYHGQAQTCLDAVSAFQRCADDQGVILVAPSWEGVAADVDAATSRMGTLLEVLPYTLGCLGPVAQRPVVAGLGTGASVALRAVLLDDPYFLFAISFCGPRVAEWEHRPAASPWQRAVYLAARAGSQAQDSYAALAEYLAKQGVSTTCVALKTCDPVPASETIAAWRWIAERQTTSLRR